LYKDEELKIHIPAKNTEMQISEKKTTEEMSNKLLMTDSSIGHSDFNNQVSLKR